MVQILLECNARSKTATKMVEVLRSMSVFTVNEDFINFNTKQAMKDAIDGNSIDCGTYKNYLKNNR